MKVFIGDLFDWQDADAKRMYITSDSRQFIIAIERDVKDPKTGEVKQTTMPEYYYTNLPALLNKLLTMRIKETAATTLTELAADVKAIKDRIDEVLGDIKGR